MFKECEGLLKRPQLCSTEVTASGRQPSVAGPEVIKLTFRHLHPAGSFLFAVIRVRGRGVGWGLALPLHGDGNITALQVPAGIPANLVIQSNILASAIKMKPHHHKLSFLNHICTWQRCPDSWSAGRSRQSGRWSWSPPGKRTCSPP